ncbi:COMM domain-containing protein 4 [Leguminivora glycinivorella]|uniref:COMM domain-containing protein 4 n=1 Tax=Leguminivora glycinivorella TaxID=1035111 RepID=UPI00200FC6A6|nr:COMM domain-containing protein 4 [Leguminivora glycinivorella]
MKFKFCSDGDCPLWALAALHALGSLPAAVFRAVLQHIVDELPEDGIMDILKDTSLSSRDESARAAAAIRWVLRQTWRGGCPGTQLTRDLLVLGLPRTHASALAEAADNGREAYEAKIQMSGFMVNRLTDVTTSPGPEGTVDTIKLSLHSDDVTGERTQDTVLVHKSQVTTLLKELKQAYLKIEELDGVK